MTEEVEDPKGKATDPLEEVEAEAEEEEADEPQTTNAANSSTSNAKKKKKKSKALAKLKKKLTNGTEPSNEESETPAEGTAEKTKNLSKEEVFAMVKNKVESDVGSEAANRLTPETLEALMKSKELQNYLKGKAGLDGKHKKSMGDHKFWATQPVPKLGTNLNQVEEGAIEEDKPLEAIQAEPYGLPKDFEWVNVDLGNDAQLKEVQELLTNHYIEDEDASFRFNYMAPFIRWALQVPEYLPDWHVGVRVTSSKKLVGFIAGIPMTLQIRSNVKKICEINFLCVHKKLRGKRLAPVLIKEVTRRVNLTGIFQAVYTAGVFIPTPISRCQYFHRMLDVKQLVDTGFAKVPRGGTLGALMSHNRLDSEPSLPGLRPLEPRDVKEVTVLLRSYLSRLDLFPIFSEEEFHHYFLSGCGAGEIVEGRKKDQVVWSYVVEDEKTGKITDFISYYCVPSTAMKTIPPSTVDAAYLFYYATTKCPACASLVQGDISPEGPSRVTAWHEETLDERRKLRNRLGELVKDALILAKKQKFHVFNALTLCDSSLVFDDLKFGAGDGFLHFYMYNWKVRPIAGGCLGDPAQPIGSDNRIVHSSQPTGLGGRASGSGIGLVML